MMSRLFVIKFIFLFLGLPMIVRFSLKQTTTVDTGACVEKISSNFATTFQNSTHTRVGHKIDIKMA